MQIDDAAVPARSTILGWIREVVAQGIRRPGYPADDWAEGWIAARFRALGLEGVHAEPIDVRRWEPTAWSLEVTGADGRTTPVDCFPLPYARPVAGLDVELAAYDDRDPAAVAGKAALRDITLVRLPGNLLARAGSAPQDPAALAARIVDPAGTLAGEHILPFGVEVMAVMDPAAAAGAAAFVGVLRGYPGDSHHYYVPYDAVDRPLPGVWISESAGARLRELLAAGPVRLRLTVESECRTATSHNIVGQLPGADDEVVMIGSHHDGPWNSAVEDGSGIALVLAQAAYWAAQPAEARPHRLVFLLQGGHMSGGAGLHGYIAAHRAELARVVLELHLEHAALEVTDDGPTGRPVPRWWFTSRNPDLEAGVVAALTAEGLDRSLLLAPDALGAQPTTDGGYYHTEGVPIVNFLAAPFYLFDAMDTLDKIDADNLVPLTRAAARIVSATAGIDAATMRAGVVAPSAGPSAG